MEDLPIPHESLSALAPALIALDRRFPGLLDEVVELAEGDALSAEVRRLRGPKVSPETRESLRRAAAWLAAIRLISKATRGPTPAAPIGPRRRGWPWMQPHG
jgi:hypothetical protein